MTQVIASNTNNTVKVYSVGLQGATGPSGSLQSSNSGSFSITGSLIVSGSNTFTNIGPSIFSGSVTSTSGFTGSLQGTSSFATSASYVLNAVSASFATSSSRAISSSFATTASFALNAGTTVSTASLLTTGSSTNNVLTFTKGDGSTFNLTVDTGSAITTPTGSLMVTGSVSSNTLTFTKGDGSTFNLTVNTGSAATVNTGSLMVTGSVSSNTLTFTKGDGSTFNLTVNTGSAVTVNTSSLMVTGSVSSNTLTFTKGDGSTFNLTVATGSSGGSAFPFSGSAIITGSLIISGSSNPSLAGDTRGLQINNAGSANLRITSKNDGVTFITEGLGPNSWYLNTTATQFGYSGNIYIHTTGSGMGNGSILGSLNWGKGGNDSFGSIKGSLQGVNQSTISIYSSTFGALDYDGLPDISFISASLIDVNRKIETDKDIEITDSSKGIILRSPNGTRYRITINDSGILVSGSI